MALHFTRRFVCQNQRMVWIGTDFRDHPVPTP